MLITAHNLHHFEDIQKCGVQGGITEKRLYSIGSPWTTDFALRMNQSFCQVKRTPN